MQNPSDVFSKILDDSFKETMDDFRRICEKLTEECKKIENFTDAFSSNVKQKLVSARNEFCILLRKMYEKEDEPLWFMPYGLVGIIDDKLVFISSTQKNSFLIDERDSETWSLGVSFLKPLKHATDDDIFPLMASFAFNYENSEQVKNAADYCKNELDAFINKLS